MTRIVFSKGVGRGCNKEEMAYLEKHIREMVDEMESTTKVVFMPYPATAEEVKEYGNIQIQVTFFPIMENRERMVMIVPLFIKEDKENSWYVQMKDEFGKIELDIRTPVEEGHHRAKRH